MRAYERLLKYIKWDTTSDEDAPEGICPSTPGQKDFALSLAAEMKSLGLSGVHLDSHGYVYGTLEANCETDSPTLGLIAHMDTSPSAKGADIQSRIVQNYDGKDILLNRENSIVMHASDYESLSDYVGQDLIVTDGTTLLGADDKSGIAEILTAVENIISQEVKHGTVQIAFTPDEEIGRGADLFDVQGFGADFAYTVDGGKIGELEYENFNAASAEIRISGVNIHPGDAKNKMKNALLIGMEFNRLLPPHEIPACTEGYEGFYHLTNFSGNEESAVMHYIIRDHDRRKFECRKERMQKNADYLNEIYGAKTVSLQLRDSYYNMKEKVEPHLFLIENAKKAMSQAGVTPRVLPIRGGTDGARLSFMGLPCPNLSTGGHNFHGRFEYISVQAMDKMTEVLINLIRVE